jgi:NADPH:quinone reductase-like Zn-dependent oxidoreductase
MKAIVYTEYGSPDVLKLQEVAKPAPREHEVLVKVSTVAINDWDWALLQGIPFVNRLFRSLFKPQQNILGSDVAGRVEAVGPNVTRFQPGDEVYGDLSGDWGGFAEYVCAREDALALKPARMTFEEAAAIPQAAMLAVQGLRAQGNLRPGQKLLINGAGGGVGTFGVQIAKLAGVEVTGVDKAGKLEMMRTLGFDQVIDYTQEDFTRKGERYDLILDTKTNRSVFAYLRALSPRGAYVTVGGSTIPLLKVVILGSLISLLTPKRARLVILKPNKDLAYINELFEAGKIKPVIDGPYTLAEVPQAFRLFAAGNHKGKVVITVASHNS